MKLHPVEYSIYNILKSEAQHSFLLGVSGGLDSMVLLHLFWRISKKTPLNFAVAYIHHGSSGSTAQDRHRDLAKKFVESTCRKYNVPFFFKAGPSHPIKNDEATLRQYRLQALKEMPFDRIVLAHHRDDLLETRLIRLIRGTGPQGLKAMNELSNEIFRPMLKFSRAQIQEYAQKFQIQWLEDPSNQDPKILRNWIRQIWLPSLEQKRPGAIEALGRSLELLSQNIFVGEEKSKDSLDREEMSQLSLAKKQQLIASFLKQKQVTNYSLNQINEVIKRLNTRRKQFEFTVARVKWQVGPRELKISKE